MIKYSIFGLLSLAILMGLAFFAARGREIKPMRWGVTFSVPQAESLGLDWQKTYIALLDELGVRRVRLIAEWDSVEPRPDKYDFSEIDWQIRELEKRGGRAIVVLGMKVPRWPECHLPDWAKKLDEAKQKETLLAQIRATISHLAPSPAITTWQVENEPFFYFGECPWAADKDFITREVAAVKAADPSRPIMITDSGEWSWFFTASKLGDVVGTTLYRKVWFGPWERYVTYPFSPAYYASKIYLAQKLFGKKFIDVELQAEPWTASGFKNTPPEEIKKTFSLDQFKNNLDFSRRAGEDEVYLWGAEWWYYMKENNHPEFWEEAKKLFKEQ